jgi:hypothetical protein
VETNLHLQLKRLAIGFLRGQGCQAVATEVRCPIARDRVDVAGYLDRPPRDRANGRRERCAPSTVLIECKQSRSDFLRDHREADRLLDLRDELERLREHIEQSRIRTHEPHLRQAGTSLFPELDDWNYGASRLRGYRALVRRIRNVLADRLYLAAPRGMIRPRDLPRGWGLLERTSRRSDSGLHVAVEAPPQSSLPRHRVRLLRNIAVRASRMALEHARG